MPLLETLGGAAFGAVLTILLEKMASQKFLDLFKKWKFNAALLPKLKFVLLTVRVVLSDAEEKQFTNPFVKEWLDELKDSVYEAEDVLDEIATEALQGNSETTSYKESIEFKVEEIIKRLESIAQQKDVLGLTERLGGRPPLRSPSTSLVDESEIFGRENDKKAILDFLLPTFGNANDMPSNQVPARNGVTVVNVNEALESQETKVKGNGALRLPANENGVPANENGIVAKKNAALQAQVNDFIAANQDGVPTVTEDVVFPANENRVPVMRDEKISERDFAAVGVEIPVVAVVGMPGVGKTTLAQLLFNDSRVKKIFDKRRVWVHVSEEFDILKITKTIYQCVTSSFECPADLNSLQVKLQENLEKKKFLFVLDDIWNENFVDWDVLQRPFKAADSQSRIIVTTRSRNVALIMRAAHTYHLKTLSDDDCWSLFAKHAFGPGIPKKHVEKKEIGEEIAKRCNGLPLAAKTLGALLYAKAEIDEWVGVLNSEVWDLPSDKSNILPALRLSYSHLPSHLKRCFAYCSVLPKSKLFEKAHLIMLWRAEGLLPRRKKRLEDVGDEYFRELLSRSFFHDCDKKYFKMHDLFIDLAKSVAAGEFFFKSEDGILHEVPETVRYFSFTAGKVDDSEQFDAFQGANHLRTFLLLKHPSSLGAHRLSTSAFANLMQALKFSHLRVLSLRDYHIGNLHDSIGNLKYLRYLDISGTGIQELGESVCSLYNLETLLLSRCTELKKLPNNMHNLINLQHLDVSRTKVEELPETVCSLYNLETLLLSGCTMLSKLPNDMQNLTNLQHLDISRTTVMEMPPQFGRLKRLHVLTAFVVGDGHSTISELKELSNLRTLSILRLEKVHDGDAWAANLKEKKLLSELVLQWTPRTNAQGNTNAILDQLQPHKNLKKLTVENFRGTTFPNWLGNASLSKLVSLHIIGCGNCSSILLPLGQLSSLKELCLAGMENLTTMDFGFCSSSSSSIEPTVDSVANLKLLSVSECNNLQSMPQQMQRLTSLRTLTIAECAALASFPDGGLPVNLELLSVSKCNRLQSMPEQMQSLTSLKILTISECAALLSFPDGGLPANLQSLSVSICSSLRSMPEQMQSLTSLHELKISECRNLESFPDGLPSNLKSLSIIECNNQLIPQRGWGLHNMASLTSFDIQGGCSGVESFPDEGLLPAALNVVHISGFRDLKSLNLKGFRNLNFLKTLNICDCNNLNCMSDGQLPLSLDLLNIIGSPLLKERCEVGGEYWNKISHISEIFIE